MQGNRGDDKSANDRQATIDDLKAKLKSQKELFD